MGTVDYRDLIRHMEWADACTWSAVLGVPELQEDPRVRERFYHFHTTQWAYLQIWRREPVQIPQPSSFADLKAMGRWARAFYRELPSFLNGIDDAMLGHPIDFPWAAQLEERLGKVTPATLAESLLQLCLHTAHHRGQVVTKIREAGGEPPLIDYVAWVWTGRPAPEWQEID